MRLNPRSLVTRPFDRWIAFARRFSGPFRAPRTCCCRFRWTGWADCCTKSSKPPSHSSGSERASFVSVPTAGGGLQQGRGRVAVGSRPRRSATSSGRLVRACTGTAWSNRGRHRVPRPNRPARGETPTPPSRRPNSPIRLGSRVLHQHQCARPEHASKPRNCPIRSPEYGFIPVERSSRDRRFALSCSRSKDRKSAGWAIS